MIYRETGLDLLDSLRAGPATIAGLVQDTGRTRKAVERAVGRLMAQGWVERDPSTVRLGGNRWAFVHRITRAGRLALAKSSTVVAEGGSVTGLGTSPARSRGRPRHASSAAATSRKESR